MITFQHEWWRTLIGLAFIMMVGALVGCKEEITIDSSEIAVPAPNSSTVDPRRAIPIENVLPPAGVENSYIGIPNVVPDMTPIEEKDPDWDCTPTDNRYINDWLRDAKCGGKLDGE